VVTGIYKAILFKDSKISAYNPISQFKHDSTFTISMSFVLLSGVVGLSQFTIWLYGVDSQFITLKLVGKKF
jgi:hypothetical protein